MCPRAGDLADIPILKGVLLYFFSSVKSIRLVEIHSLFCFSSGLDCSLYWTHPLETLRPLGLD